MPHPIVDTSVAIFGPEHRSVGLRGCALPKIECCYARIKGRDIILIPRNSQGIAAAKGEWPFGFIEVDRIEDLRSVLGTRKPTFTFTGLEVLVIIRHLLNDSFVVFAGQGKTEGYLIRYGDLDWGPRSQINRGATSSASLHHVDLCRALRIEVLDDGAGVATTAQVIEKSGLAKFQDRLFRIGTWQRRVWENSAGCIPDSEIEDYRILYAPLEPRTIEGFAATIDKTNRERLYFSLRLNSWAAVNEKRLNQSEETGKVFGETPDQEGNFLNKLARTGLITPPISIAKEQFKQLQNEARAYIKKFGEKKILEHDGAEPFADELILKPLLAILFPEDFGRVLSMARWPNDIEEFASAKTLHEP